MLLGILTSLVLDLYQTYWPADRNLLTGIFGREFNLNDYPFGEYT